MCSFGVTFARTTVNYLALHCKCAHLRGCILSTWSDSRNILSVSCIRSSMLWGVFDAEKFAYERNFPWSEAVLTLGVNRKHNHTWTRKKKTMNVCVYVFLRFEFLKGTSKWRFLFQGWELIYVCIECTLRDVEFSTEARKRLSNEKNGSNFTPHTQVQIRIHLGFPNL